MKRCELRARADGLLEEIREKTLELEGLRRQADIEMQQVRERYAAQVANAQADIKMLDKCIVTLMRDCSAEIFRGGDKVSLENGWLLHTKNYKVKIPRGAVEKLEGLGWNHLVKVAKSVDREAVEALPESDLSRIGAEKKKVEKYAYEIRDHS